MSWQWFHRLGSPRWFYEKTERWSFWLGLVATALIVIGAVWGLGFAPSEAKQGNSARIMYIHIPLAVLSMGCYAIAAIAGGIGLIWRMKLSFMVMKSCAPIGAIFTAAALATGAIWGKPTWGAYWVWDARITSMTVMLLLYLAIIALQQAYQNQDSADKVCAVLALVGVVNLPIIKYSVEWWNSLHQPASIKIIGKSTIDPSMAYPLLVMFIGFYIFFVGVLLLRTRVEILKREQRTNWVQTIVAGE